MSELWTAITVRLYNLWDFVRVVFHYYRNTQFARVDLSLLMSYFWKSPYRIAREFDAQPYGETPLVTMEKIARMAHITEEDIVLELGSGRGRCVFWLAFFIRCRVIGIEYNPVLVAKAKELQARFQVPNVDFIIQDMFTASFKEATVIYLYGILLSDSEIQKLCVAFSKLKRDVRIITISYSLQEYCPEVFRVIDSCDVSFPWGTTKAYLHKEFAKGGT